MKLYEEPIHFRKVSEPVLWTRDPGRATVHGILEWIRHCTGVLKSIKGLPLRIDERTIVEDLLCVIQDLDANVFSSLERKLNERSSSNAADAQQRRDLLEATECLRKALEDAPLSKSAADFPKWKEIPNLSPLELRIKLLCKQKSFASLDDLQRAIKELHKTFLQIKQDKIQRTWKIVGVPAVLFLCKVQLNPKESVCVVVCTAETLLHLTEHGGDMKKLQESYWKRRDERFLAEEKKAIENADEGYRKIGRTDTEFDIFKTSSTPVSVQGSALRTSDMTTRGRCKRCRKLHQFHMPYEQDLTEIERNRKPHYKYSCAENLVKALVKRHLDSGS